MGCRAVMCRAAGAGTLPGWGLRPSAEVMSTAPRLPSMQCNCCALMPSKRSGAYLARLGLEALRGGDVDGAALAQHAPQARLCAGQQAQLAVAAVRGRPDQRQARLDLVGALHRVLKGPAAQGALIYLQTTLLCDLVEALHHVLKGPAAQGAIIYSESTLLSELVGALHRVLHGPHRWA